MDEPTKERKKPGPKKGDATIWTLEHVLEVLEEYSKWTKINDVRHIFVNRFEIDFEEKLGIWPGWFNHMKAKYPEELSAIDNEIGLREAIKLKEGGLDNTYNSKIAQLILSAHHGVVPKSENESRGSLEITSPKEITITHRVITTTQR